MSSDPVVTSAIVLRAVAYGEADRVVTLLGRATGRVSAIARSARKSQRRFGGGLGLGARGEATLRERGDGDLMLFERFEVSEGRLGLGADVGRAAHAAYGAELCDRLCGPRQPEPGVFDLLDDLLVRLETHPLRAERLRAFELGLLGLLGIGPSWTSCVACGRRDLDDETVRLAPLRGGILCPGCARQGTPLLPAARRALVALAAGDLEASEALTLPREVNVACRHAIQELLAVHTPGPLRSMEFMSKLSGG